MTRDELATYVRRLTRQGVPDNADETELLDLLARRFRFVECAWLDSTARLTAANRAIVGVDADEHPRSATSTEGHHPHHHPLIPSCC